MKVNYLNLLSLLKGPKQFVIPIYQRPYSWKLSECKKLLDDIMKVGKNPTSKGHFIGPVLYFQEDVHLVSDVPRLKIIDGQQRITTVSLLIIALSEFLKKNPDVLSDTNYSKLRNYYLLNAEESGDLSYKLLHIKKDRDLFIKLIKNIPLESGSNSRIVENYNYFSEFINDSNVRDIYNGIMKLFIIESAIEKDDDDPQMIFESLNSTGLDLSQADLIRNFILMRLDIDTQDELYRHYWLPMEESFGSFYNSNFDTFMRFYLTAKNPRYTKVDKVYENFKLMRQTENADKEILEVIKDINLFAKFYANLVFDKESDQDLKRAFNSFSQLRMDVCYPFLLQVYNDYYNTELSKSDFIDIVSMLESYILRRSICGVLNNGLSTLFAELYKHIDKTNYLESLQVYFYNLENSRRFPKDSEFDSEFVIKNVYQFRLCKYLLSKMENWNRKELVNLDDYQIEHILPQNQNLSSEWVNMLGENWVDIQSKYLHTIGNLTLTSYNPELSDRPFSEKKTMEGGFDDSPIRLNSYLKKTQVWDEENINQRSTELLSKAKLIWPSLNISKQVLEKYKSDDDSHKNDYTLDHYEWMVGHNLDLFESLRKRILNLDTSIGVRFKKLYIAFKSVTNIVCVIPQKSKFLLNINLDFSEVNDPCGICRDVSGLGRWGNGDVEISYTNLDQLDDIMFIITQSFENQIK
jgi:uncharacterized protein with ParB-like and HNH nuclease domain/predicted transport protein